MVPKLLVKREHISQLYQHTVIFLAHIYTSEMKVLVTQSCLTLHDPTDCSLPSSSVCGVLQARILEWVAIPFFRGSS